MMSDRHRRAIEKAAELGTLGKLDRSKQYENDPEQKTAAGLLRSQNHAWKRMREIELWLKILTAAVMLIGATLTLVKAIIR